MNTTAEKLKTVINLRRQAFLMILAISFLFVPALNVYSSELTNIGLKVIPYPQQVLLGGQDCNFSKELTIVLDNQHSEADRFAAEELVRDLKKEWGINAKIDAKKGDKSIVLSRDHAPASLIGQGYHIITSGDELILNAKSEAGLF